MGVDFLQGYALGRPAPLPVVRPALLGKEQLAVHHAPRRPRGQGQVDRDRAVVGGALGPAPLLLHAGGLVPFLEVGGLVEDTHRPGIVVLLADDLHGPGPDHLVVPPGLREELLHVARRNAELQRHRLDALAFQVRQLTPHVHPHGPPLLLPREAVVEPVQVPVQFGQQRCHRCPIHARTSCTMPARLYSSVILPAQLEPIWRCSADATPARRP